MQLIHRICVDKKKKNIWAQQDSPLSKVTILSRKVQRLYRVIGTLYTERYLHGCEYEDEHLF